MELRENKAELYRTMVTYLATLGADLGVHSSARLATVVAASFDQMSEVDLLHYQRVLEATMDNPHPLMQTEAMKQELADVVGERINRGQVPDRQNEIRQLRARLAALPS